MGGNVNQAKREIVFNCSLASHSDRKRTGPGKGSSLELKIFLIFDTLHLTKCSEHGSVDIMTNRPTDQPTDGQAVS